MSGGVRIAAADLTRLAEALFVAEGVSGDHAATWAEVLVWANLRGVDSHGVLRIPRYLDQLAGGHRIDPASVVLNHAA